MLLQIAVFHSFLCLTNIPLFVCVCVCLSLSLSQIFFIRSSVDGHLGCLHVMAIVNSQPVFTFCETI